MQGKAWVLGVMAAAGAMGCSSGFEKAVSAVGREDAIVLRGDHGSSVLVSPRLQGRVMTTRVGEVDSVGFVCLPEIAEGETHASFNNFGGQDRFWLGPEAGQHGIYFEPGSELRRDLWKVPRDLNEGPFTVIEKTDHSVRFSRQMMVTSYRGLRFQARVERQVGVLSASILRDELGIDLPPDVQYAGSYSDNRLINSGREPWKKETGLINIWILGQFEPGPRTVVIMPIRPGPEPAYRDEPYFGKVPADRLKAIPGGLIFRADARKEGKVGVPQARTTGRAGSIDFEKGLLVVVEFDVPAEPALYGNSEWVKEQPQPYGGDLFQTYNSEAAPWTPSERYAFYELESVSPSVELAPGEAVKHRHATHCFQGDRKGLNQVAGAVLGVDLGEVERAMFGSGT